MTALKPLQAQSSPPKLPLLTVHTLRINDILCGFSYCEVQRFAANFVHPPGVQGPLLLGASKGFNARIQLCKKQTQLLKDLLGSMAVPSCVSTSKLWAA